VRDPATESRVRALVGEVDTLPSIPAVYLELLEELKNPETSFKSVGVIISRDVAMSAKILQLVNSAFFGFYRSVTSIDHAVGILGMKMIRSLVLSVKVFSQFDGAKMELFRIDALMNHSVATGALARIIARAQCKDAALAEDAFMGGMLHDVGKLVLAERAGGDYAKAVQLAAEKGVPPRQAERETFGVTHEDVGAYLLAHWGLPAVIVDTIAYHHRPSLSAGWSFGPLCLVHVANVLEHREHGADKTGIRQDVDMAYLAEIGMADRLDKWAEICHVLARGDKQTPPPIPQRERSLVAVA
jgi:putative nucleotidyltransferase with HDIG domain